MEALVCIDHQHLLMKGVIYFWSLASWHLDSHTHPIAFSPDSSLEGLGAGKAINPIEQLGKEGQEGNDCCLHVFLCRWVWAVGLTECCHQLCTLQVRKWVQRGEVTCSRSHS